MASSTACRFRTGRAPGKPRQTGQVFALGGAPKLVGHPQKILVAVASCTCTSRPITGSYFAISSGGARSMKLVDISHSLYGAKPGAGQPERSRGSSRRGHARPALAQFAAEEPPLRLRAGAG